MVKGTYSPAQLIWLARWLKKTEKAGKRGRRKELIKEFARAFVGAERLSPGKLANIYVRHGGTQEEFVKAYYCRSVSKPRQVPEPATTPTLDPAEEAKRDGVIAQAFLDWDPGTASFVNAFAFAAARVNQTFGTKCTADDIETAVRQKSGVFEFICDSTTLTAQEAKRVAARVHQDKVR